MDLLWKLKIPTWLFMGKCIFCSLTANADQFGWHTFLVNPGYKEAVTNWAHPQNHSYWNLNSLMQ
jgi:hypothetical protein